MVALEVEVVEVLEECIVVVEGGMARAGAVAEVEEIDSCSVVGPADLVDRAAVHSGVVEVAATAVKDGTALNYLLFVACTVM